MIVFIIIFVSALPNPFTDCQEKNHPINSEVVPAILFNRQQSAAAPFTEMLPREKIGFRMGLKLTVRSSHNFGRRIFRFVKLDGDWSSPGKGIQRHPCDYAIRTADYLTAACIDTMTRQVCRLAADMISQRQSVKGCPERVFSLVIDPHSTPSLHCILQLV